MNRRLLQVPMLGLTLLASAVISASEKTTLYYNGPIYTANANQ